MSIIIPPSSKGTYGIAVNGIAVKGYSPTQVGITRELATRLLDEEVKMGYSHIKTNIVVGLVAGLLVWMIPLPLFIFNWLLGIASSGRGSYGISLVPFVLQTPFLLGVAITGMLGIVQAVSRRWTIRNGRFWDVRWPYNGVTVRFGADDLIGSIVGTLALLWGLRVAGVGSSFYWFLYVIPLPGYIFCALWEGLYGPLIRRFGRASSEDKVLMVVTSLSHDPHLREQCKIMSHIFDEQSGQLVIAVNAESDDALGYLKSRLGSSPIITSVVQSLSISRV